MSSEDYNGINDENSYETQETVTKMSCSDDELDNKCSELSMSPTADAEPKKSPEETISPKIEDIEIKVEKPDFYDEFGKDDEVAEGTIVNEEYENYSDANKLAEDSLASIYGEGQGSHFLSDFGDGHCEKNDTLMALYSCEICLNIFLTKSEQKHHFCPQNELSELPTQSNQCPKCHYVFQSKAYLKRHIGKNKCRFSEATCHLCNETFDQKILLKSHLRTHKDLHPYVCTECDKTFFRHSEMTRHLRIHTGDRRYVCHICERRFVESGQLKDHIRTHTGEKPYHCHLCDYKSAISSSLKRHIRTHTGEKIYGCEVCGAKFGGYNSLKIHLRGHTGEKPYQCDLCEYRCTNLSGIKVHRRSHTGEKSKKCKICDYRSAYSSDVKRHVARAHPETLESCEIQNKLYSKISE